MNMNDLNMNCSTSEAPVSQNQMRLATAYLTSGMLLDDASARAREIAIRMVFTSSQPCSGWCYEMNDTTWIMRDAGNDLKKSRALSIEHLEKGISCACRQCSDKHFLVADALDYHMKMLRCVRSGDDQGALSAANQRGEKLRKLGYRIA